MLPNAGTIHVHVLPDGVGNADKIQGQGIHKVPQSCAK
jgi:hypothetical protein